MLMRKDRRRKREGRDGGVFLDGGDQRHDGEMEEDMGREER